MAESEITLTRQQRRARARAARKVARGAIAIGAMLAAGAASAATITVNSLADTTVAGDTQCTLREALTNANSGSDTTGADCSPGVAGLDTIVFQPALTGTITLGGSELPAIYDSVTINGPGAAVITVSGDTSARIFEIQNPSSTTPIDVNINSLTLQDGSEFYGGAISIDSENVTIDHVVATANFAYAGGAVAFSDYDGATLSITNSTISGNGALGVGGGVGIYNGYGAVTISNSVVTGNSALFGNGGGIYAEYLNGPFSISGSTISGNTAPQGDGGGIYAAGLYDDLTITNSTLSGNLAGITTTGHGGALDVRYTYASVYIRHDTFGGPNPADANQAGLEGGAVNVVMADGAFFQMQNTHVLNNIAGMQTGYFGDSGGVRLEASGEVGAVATAEITDSVISGNIADPQDGTAVNNNPSDVGYGGGVYLKGYLSTTISGTTISGNTAAFGGGVYVYTYADATFVNSTIANNTAASPAVPGYGGGVILSTEYGVEFDETTISGNTAQGGGGIYAYLGDVTLNNAIVANSNGAPDIVANGSVTANYTLVEDPGSLVLGGTGNITGTDPALGTLADNGSTILAGDPNGTEVHPQTELPASDSAVVNTGDPAFTPPPATDERGATRVEGGRIDMGAAEIAPPTIAIGDVSQAEGNGGTTAFDFQVTLSAPSAQTVTVSYATADGTATAPSDYASASGVVTFTPGQTLQTVTVDVVGDTAIEPDETFTVDLSSPSANASIADATGTGTIQNDDANNVDLAIDKSAGAGPFFVGQNLTYTISVSNGGPASATAVTVTDTIPAGTAFVSATPSQGTCSGTTTVTCTLGAIANGGDATIALTVTPTAPGPVSNTATALAGAQADTDPTNSSSTANVTVLAAASIPTFSHWVEMMLAMMIGLLGVLKIGKE